MCGLHVDYAVNEDSIPTDCISIMQETNIIILRDAQGLYTRTQTAQLLKVDSRTWDYAKWDVLGKLPGRLHYLVEPPMASVPFADAYKLNLCNLLAQPG